LARQRSDQEARQRELALERERKAALMEHLFTHGTRGEQTKQTEIGEIPESWQVKPFDDLVTKKQYGLSVRGQERGEVAILRMNNLVEGKIDASDLQQVDIDAELLKAFKLERGDLLFNRTNSQDLVGKTSLFESDDPFVFASYLIRLRIDIAQAIPAFVNSYLNRENVVRQVQMLATRGVSQSNISASKLGRFPLPVPPISEQREIAAAGQACDRKIETLDAERERLEELFNAMLEELMSGRLSGVPLVEEHQPQ
jgi:type I restriction enzyme S subunit